MALAGRCRADSVNEGRGGRQLPTGRALSMKVLITGAAGQVGRALLDSAPGGLEILGQTHKELDIVDARAVMAHVQGLRPDVIVNAAAYTAVDRAQAEAELARRINTDGSRN